MVRMPPPAVFSQLRSWRRLHLSAVLVVLSLLLMFWHLCTVSLPGLASTTTTHSIPDNVNPILRRLLEANATYTQMLQRQSKDVSHARKEYRRRYKMEPPDGFDGWFAYAQKHKSLIIDDFDEIHDKLAPYREYLKTDCDTRDVDADYLGSRHLLRVCVRGGKVTFHGSEKADWVVATFTHMLSDFVASLPDICFLLNLLDEPRVLLPRDQLGLNTASSSSSSTPPPPPKEAFCPMPTFVSYEKQDWWSQLTLSCPPDSAARLYPGKVDKSRNGALLGDWKSSSDLCAYSAPIEHGAIVSPSTALLTHTLIPILSNAGLSTNNDILFPTMWRYEFWDEYEADKDVPWEEKQSKGYWRGSTTGGQATSHIWEKFQRHRFVKFANEKDNPVSDKMDVRFSKVLQCDRDACDEENAQFEVDGKQPFSDIWKSKIAFDIDGNGLSGRFYPLLRSNSAVFRQGIFREWHDSRIQPWLHYVPVSMELTELKELLNYYLGEGDEVLKEIARAGQVMVDTTLRRDDMHIYLYRLLLEMGRR